MDRWAGRRGEIAQLSGVVVEAEASGDAVAVTILHEACGGLAGLVETCRVALGYKSDESMLVSYAGSVFSAPTIRPDSDPVMRSCCCGTMPKSVPRSTRRSWPAASRTRRTCT